MLRKTRFMLTTWCLMLTSFKSMVKSRRHWSRASRLLIRDSDLIQILLNWNQLLDLELSLLIRTPLVIISMDRTTLVTSLRLRISVSVLSSTWTRRLISSVKRKTNWKRLKIPASARSSSAKSWFLHASQCTIRTCWPRTWPKLKGKPMFSTHTRKFATSEVTE